MSDLLAALKLVQNDYIGGSGSRGSGQISFKINSIKGRTPEFYLETGAEIDLISKYQDNLSK
jgi:CRISPR-associated protein Csm3